MQRPATLNLVFADSWVKPGESGLNDNFFENQYYAAEWRFPTSLFGMPGSQNIGYNYNSKEFLQLDNLTEQFITRKKSSNDGASVVYYNFHQYVYVEPGQDTTSIGYDADPTRDDDTFGIA